MWQINILLAPNAKTADAYTAYESFDGRGGGGALLTRDITTTLTPLIGEDITNCVQGVVHFSANS